MGSIIWGVLMIIGGLSGQMVLIGTNSSGALVAVGCALLGWGVLRKTVLKPNEE
jgi:hypothetical protein